MFLGLRSKSKKITSVEVDYVVYIQEIAPWPPSQSLKTLRSVILQWQYGDNVSGLIQPASSIEEGKIQFKKSFKLHVTLSKGGPVRGQDGGQYYKSLLELNLYEPRNKNVKGQHIGSAMVDLAEHGIIKKAVSIGVPFSCKRSFKNSSQPVFYIKIQPYDRASSSFSLESLPKEMLLDKDGKESVSSVTTEEQGEEVEISSFTDEDDAKSQQSSNDPEGNKWTGTENKDDQVHLKSTSEASKVILSENETSPKVPFATDEAPARTQVDVNSRSSEMDASSVMSFALKISEEHIDNSLTLSACQKLDVMPCDEVSSKASLTTDESATQSSTLKDTNSRSSDSNYVSSSPALQSPAEPIVDSFASLVACQTPDMIPPDEESSEVAVTKYERETQTSIVDMNRSPEVDYVSPSVCSVSTSSTLKMLEEPSIDSLVSYSVYQKLEEETRPVTVDARVDLIQAEEKLVECNITTVEDLQPSRREEVQHDISCTKKTSVSEFQTEENIEVKGSNIAVPEEQHCPQSNISTENSPSSDEHRENTLLSDQHMVQRGSKTLKSESAVLSRRMLGGRMRSINQSKHVRSVTVDYGEDFEDVKEIDVLGDTYGANRMLLQNNTENVKKTSSRIPSNLSNYKIKELEKRVEILERELREIAAIEISLYSVVAEHGSSAHKVHAPARRLSRLCNYALENWSPEGRASATRSIISGLILAARACGNDVPRLSFWLSNSIVLRATISTDIEGPSSTPPATKTSVGHAISAPSDSKKRSLKWEQNGRDKSVSFSNESNNWQDLPVFLEALEKVEAWIFSRIVESIWWQILTPRMQSGSDSEIKLKLHEKRKTFMSPRFSDQRTGYSINHWKNAFKESYERLCPSRAEGHDCGCLPLLSRLVMEQCIARLDVAMFNAILRESDDDMPGNPLSDPISECKVLPIAPGKFSFGAGAQLKNAIGTWSRWLTDLFGIDDGLSEAEDHDDNGTTTSSKTFYLLNALSDLLMLPKDMLLDSSTRKEACPILGEPLLKRILGSFVSDEFCADALPDTLFEALDSEDSKEDGDAITLFPCDVAPVVYQPPSMMSVMHVIGRIQNHSLQRSSSSMPRKCHTSDDELEELNSPLTSIITTDKLISATTDKERSSTNVVRYQLLREVWMHGD